MRLGLGDYVMFLGPATALTSFILILMGFLGPNEIPGRALVTLSPRSQYEGLPKILLGLTGTCELDNNNRTTMCRGLANGNYSFQGMSNQTMRDILRPPDTVHLVLISISFAFSVIFFLIWLWPIDWVTIIHVTSDEEGRQGGQHGLTKQQMLQNLLVCIPPLLALVLGVPTFLSVYMFFYKTCNDFNNFDSRQQNVQFNATTSNGFIFAWTGYGLLFTATIVVCVHAFKIQRPTEEEREARRERQREAEALAAQGLPAPAPEEERVRFIKVQPVSFFHWARTLCIWLGEFKSAIENAREVL